MWPFCIGRARPSCGPSGRWWGSLCGRAVLLERQVCLIVRSVAFDGGPQEADHPTLGVDFYPERSDAVID